MNGGVRIMCGVVGLLTPEGRSLETHIDLMSAAVQHRGPDDKGRWVDAGLGVALGHRRLAIIDLSPAGHQPMTSADGRWVLVLNGEIYNYAAHRSRLESAGVRFRGHSDTEVLLELIAAHGPESAVTLVDGMFAMGVWDRRDHVLILARDRMGEKPLYYGRVGTVFAFASELGAIRALPGAPNQPDPQALADYLRYGFVPAPHSILSGIRKLPAGCVVRVARASGAREPVPYWSLHDVARAGLADPLSVDDRELTALADASLRESVQHRLEADVPVGVFLSGGLDSSTLAALAQAVSNKAVKTFTVGVGGEADESDAAAAVAGHLGTDHTTLPLAELDPLTAASQVASIYDEPFADPSGVPTAMLCAAARKHVTVALSGDGADELLGGYNRYRVAQGGLSRVLALPAPLKQGAARALSAVSPRGWDHMARVVPGFPPAAGTKAHKLAAVLSAKDSLDAYDVLARQWDPASLMTSHHPAPMSAVLDGAPPLARMMLVDQQRTLPDDMLVKVDRASMAVGLEARVPFLSHHVVEFSWRLPERAKIRDGQGKWLLRQVLGQYVPETFWDRPKVGFDPPLAEWLRGPLREWSHDLLSPERIGRQGILRPGPISQALEDHDSGRRNNDYALWTVLMLQSWMETSTP